MHDRDGNPERSILSCLLDDGRRAWGETSDLGAGRDMCVTEWVGTRVRLDASGNLLV